MGYVLASAISKEPLSVACLAKLPCLVQVCFGLESAPVPEDAWDYNCREYKSLLQLLHDLRCPSDRSRLPSVQSCVGVLQLLDDFLYLKRSKFYGKCLHLPGEGAGAVGG